MSLYKDIYDLLERDGRIGRRYDHYFSCHCISPDHPDATPSLLIYEDADKPDGKGRAYCTGCGFSKDHAYVLRMLTHGQINVMPIVSKKQQFLPNWRKWNEKYDNLENLVEAAHQMTVIDPEQQWFFRKREIKTMIEPLKLGMLDGWAFFPIFDQQHTVIDIVVRNAYTNKQGYIIHPDKERESPYLYVPNWKRVMDNNLVYIVYGIIDAISLEMCGLPVITGTSGQSLSNKRLMNLGKKYAIIPDRNEEQAAYRLAQSLGYFTKVIRLRWEDGEKDCDEVRVHRGESVLKSLILGA